VLLAFVTVVSFGLACFGLRLFGFMQQHAPAVLTPYTTVAQAAFGFYSPLTRSWEFAAGALLAFAAASSTPRWVRTGGAFGVFGIALTVVSLVAISDTTPFPRRVDPASRGWGAPVTCGRVQSRGFKSCVALALRRPAGQSR
jgi:peptidoglycan/LPS O-acetylase OafA/YrhL